MTAVGLVKTLDGIHTYEDPFDPSHFFPSVTTVLSECTNRPWLQNWSAKLAAETAVDKLDAWLPVLNEMGRDAAVDLLKGAAKRRRQEAADRGSLTHDLIEAAVLGGHMPDVSPEQEPYLEAFIQWFVDFAPEIEMTEATIINWTHDWAGTGDLVVTIPWLDGFRVLVDTKTGVNLDGGMSVQVDVYRKGESVALPLGQVVDMPKTDAGAILHLRPEEYAEVGGYKFILIEDDGGARYERFLAMRAEYGHRQAAKKRSKPGRVIYPPLPDGSQPSPLLEDLEGWGRACSALRKAGLRRVEDVANLTRAELLACKGVGKKTTETAVELLAAHGLTLRQTIEEVLLDALRADSAEEVA